jgi:NADP-dependent 3-hydroxy acid dehydrogenase YdfG
MSTPVALVAGASSDLGAAIVHRLVGAGAYVFGLGRDRARLSRMAEACPERIEPVAADLTRPEDVAAVRERLAEHARLDMLVLGSGIYERSNDPEVLARQFAANVQGPYSLLQSMLPLLIEAQGNVVFINSTQGLSASPTIGQYAATQHALRAIADSLRDEINPLGVRVTSIFLGRTATARQEAIFKLEQRPYQPERLIQPDDVAGLVLSLLLLPATSEITNISIRPRLKT